MGIRWNVAYRFEEIYRFEFLHVDKQGYIRLFTRKTIFLVAILSLLHVF